MPQRRKDDHYQRRDRLTHEDPVLVEHYADVIAAFPDAVIVKDEHGTIRFAQNKVMRFFCDAGVEEIVSWGEMRPGSTRSANATLNEMRAAIVRKPAPYPGAPTMNDLISRYFDGDFTCEELMLFYQGIGYSLSGFLECWGEEVTRLYKAGLCLLANGDVVERSVAPVPVKKEPVRMTHGERGAMLGPDASKIRFSGRDDE